MRGIRLALVIAVQLSSLPTAAEASVETGAIQGSIIDSADGGPIAGVRIAVVATDRRVESGGDGSFALFDLAPGGYDLTLTKRGYRDTLIAGVKVAASRITRLAVRMTALPSPSPAEKSTVVSHGAIILDSIDLQQFPAVRLEEVLAYQMGVDYNCRWDQGTGLSIRGGDVGESNIYLDGTPLMNHLINVPAPLPNRGAVETVGIQRGGFSAGYGDIRSGLVEVMTRSGSRDRYSLSIDASYSQAGRKHFGPHAYDQNGRIWEIFAGRSSFDDPPLRTEYRFEDGSQLASRWGIDFKGWDEMALDYATNSSRVDDDLNPQAALELWKWRHRPMNYGDHPDYTVDISLGGPVPGKIIPVLGGFLEDLTFQTSYGRERTMFPYPVAREDYLRETASLKLTWSPDPSERVTIYGLYSQAASVDSNNAGNEYYQELGTRGRPDGTWWGMERAASYFMFEEMYNNGFQFQAEDYNGLVEARWTKQFSPKTSAEVRLDYRSWKVFKAHMEWRDTARVKKIGKTWYDETPRDYAESTATGTDQVGMFNLGDGARGADFSEWKSLAVRSDVTRDIGRNQRIVFGLEYSMERLTDRVRTAQRKTSWLPVPGEPPDTNWQWWDAEPARGGIFLEDRFSYGGISGHVGFRLDYLNPDYHRYDLQDRYNRLYDYNRWGDSFPIRWPEMVIGQGTARRELSPTVALSFPWGNSAAINFNYGRYQQAPEARKMYAVQARQAAWGYPIMVSNTEHPWPRTTSYELGYERRFLASCSLNLAGYYQDIGREPAMVQSYSATGAIRVMNYVPRGYADRRGIELRLSKPRGRFLTGWAGLEYDRYTGGAVGQEIFYQKKTEGGVGYYDAWLALIKETSQILVRSREQIYRSAPTAKMLLNLHTPHSWGPGIRGFRPLESMTVSLFHLWMAQNPILYGKTDTLLQKDILLQRVNHQETRLMAEKRFGRGSGLTLYLLVENPFNRKEYFDPGRPEDRAAYKASLRPGDRWGEWDEDYMDLGVADWYHFQHKRKFTFGTRLNVN